MTLIKWKNNKPANVFDTMPSLFNDFFEGVFNNDLMNREMMRYVPSVNIAERKDDFRRTRKQRAYPHCSPTAEGFGSLAWLASRCPVARRGRPLTTGSSVQRWFQPRFLPCNEQTLGAARTRMRDR